MKLLKITGWQKKTLLYSSCFIFAVLICLTFCEFRARNDFLWKRVTLESVVTKALSEMPSKIKAAWTEEASSNPSYAKYLDEYPKNFDIVSSFLYDDQGHVNDYLRQTRRWKIVYNTPSPTEGDLSRIGTKGQNSPGQVRVNIEIVYSRRMLSFFHHDPVQIFVMPAPDNSVLIKQLKAGLEEKNISYETQAKNPSPSNLNQFSEFPIEETGLNEP
jgi:hypothetical protein